MFFGVDVFHPPPTSRADIRTLILAGSIDEGIAAVDQLVPGMLASQPALLFSLKCRKFIEMVKDGAAVAMTNESLEQLMTFGQELQQMADTQSVGAANLQKLEVRSRWIVYGSGWKEKNPT